MTLFYKPLRGSLLAAAALLGLAPAGWAQQAFTPGNFVVARIDYAGISLPGDAAAPVSLAEYTFDGTLVQARTLPTADALPNLAFTLPAGQLLGGNLTRSQDGRYLVLPGFNAVPGTAGLSTSAPAALNRVVARIDAAGNVNTTSRISDALQGGLLRGAASATGAAFYALGLTDGVRYVPLGNAGPTLAVFAGNVDNPRTVQVAFGGVYLSVSNTATVLGLAQLGQGLPTTAGQALAVLPGFSTATSLSPYNFVLTDQSAAVPGPDVAYVASDGSGFFEGLVKYSLVGGTWVRSGSVAPLPGSSATLRTVAAQASGSTVKLLAGSSTGLFAGTDLGGYNAPPSFTAFAQVATAPVNTVFRGIAPAPVATALATHPAAAPEALTLYPNPTTNALTVSLATGDAAGRAWTLRDLTGRLLGAGRVPTSGQLSLAGLPAGTYLLGLEGAGTRRVCKAD